MKYNCNMKPKNDQHNILMHISTPLFKHQIQAFKWMTSITCGILGFEMGTGKTLCIINEFVTSHEKAQKEEQEFRLLYVCPKSLLQPIKEEFFSHVVGADKSIIHIYSGPSRKSASSLRKYHQASFIITTYDIVMRDTDEDSPLINDMFDRIVLDEAHIIKNTRTRKHKAVIDLPLADQGKKWCMTGTPIINKNADLLALNKFLQADDINIITDRTAWRNKYFMYAPKNSVKLPEKHIHRVSVTLSPDHQRIYTRIKESADMAIVQMTRLKQVSIHPILTEGDEELDKYIKSGRFEHSVKTKYVCDLVKKTTTTGQRVVIFSQYNRVLLLLKSQIEKGMLFNGDLSELDRQKVVKEFKSTEGAVLLINYQCGAVGLNLTNNQETHVVLMDPWWNKAIERQAIDRVYRYGQTEPVHVYRVTLAESIEDRIQEIQDNKDAMLSDFIN